MQNILLSEHLTALQAFRASGGWQYNGTDWWKPLPPSLETHSTQVSRLELERCAFSKSHIEVILGSCARLRAFIFTAGGSSVGPMNFTVRELVEVPHLHKDTLEELGLSMCPGWYYTHEPSYLPDLREFAASKEIHALAKFWDILHCAEDEAPIREPLDPSQELLSDWLPASLSHLTLKAWGMDESIDVRHISWLLHSRTITLPAFAKLTFVSGEHCCKHVQKCVKTLQKEQQPGGFDFVFEQLTQRQHRRQVSSFLEGSEQQDVFRCYLPTKVIKWRSGMYVKKDRESLYSKSDDLEPHQIYTVEDRIRDLEERERVETQM